jgi:hypothetical protein
MYEKQEVRADFEERCGDVVATIYLFRESEVVTCWKLSSF